MQEPEKIMVFGNLADVSEYSFLSERVRACIDFAKSHPLVEYEKGTHKINGDLVFVNILAYETHKAEERIWEAHKKFLDLHLMLEGTEELHLNFLAAMRLEEYKETEDYLPMTGEASARVVLRQEDFLLCLTSDAHKTGVMVNGPQKIKKAVFKIAVE